VLYALGMLPGLTLGTLDGIKLARRTREDVFRRLALAIVSVSGAAPVPLRGG